MEMVGGVPWRVNEEDAAVDGEKMDIGVKMMDETHKELLREEIKFKESASRRSDITKGERRSNSLCRSQATHWRLPTFEGRPWALSWFASASSGTAGPP